MSIRPNVWLAALVAVLGWTGAASAQIYQPFVDTGYFGQHDLQFFAPAEVGDFGGAEPPNTGLFFDYDRTYVNVNRPDGEISFGSSFDGDFTWGNRWELGYMTDEHSGWTGSIWHLSGPNEYVSRFQERLGRINDDDLDPILQDRNPRSYDIRDSINVASFSSFEFNKTWRRKKFHNGSVLEPLLGFRYMKFKNFVRRENYQRFDEDILGEPVPVPNTVDGTFEQYNQNTFVFENAMVGGQLGGRLFHQRGHWLLSADVRMFAAANFQQIATQRDERLTRYNAISGTGNPEVELELFKRARTYDQTDEFVWGGEVRAEASYEVTRDIALRFGFVFLDLAQGIGRSRSIVNNNEDVQITGLTMGLTINR
ncbi:MAG: BBP7 family outer membrane beta-barrel protein [Pirellulaceae bacterium]